MDWGRLIIIAMFVAAGIVTLLGVWLTWQRWRANRESD